MDEKTLKAKLVQWLGIKKEADVLQKAINEKAPGYRPDQGISEAGKMARYAHNAQTAGPGSTHHDNPEKAVATFTGAAKDKHKQVLSALKAQKKPNLPKSELDKAVDGPRTPEHVKGVHHDQGAFDVGTSNVGTKAREVAPGSGSSKSGKQGVIRWMKGQHKAKLQEIRSMPTPDLPGSVDKSEKLDKNDYLKNMMRQMRKEKGRPETVQSGGSIDYSKMKPARGGIVQGQRVSPRPSAAGSPKADKLFDPRLSGTAAKPVKKNAQPAAVSEPTIIQNPAILDHPNEIQSPNVLNAYKDKK